MPLAATEEALTRFSTPEGHAGEGKLSMVIWTTTPWTIPANRAVTLAEGLEYALVQI
jgi:isoleucyl-tRNA synthetase